jgi:uncharacterized protein (DUF433 family)
MPAYSIPEAAHYLRIPPSTLRAWVVGQPYATEGGRRFFRPVITPADRELRLLSFVNLVEGHVLDAIRREHEISLQRVRKALAYLAREFGSSHPLADQRFETDGVDLFIRVYGEPLNVSRAGQFAIREVVEGYLRRIERDEGGLAARLYPFTRKRTADEPRLIVIDPRVGFGRPVLTGSGIATAVIAERYKAGESIDELAEDYGRQRLDIEEAIRCELDVQAA